VNSEVDPEHPLRPERLPGGDRKLMAPLRVTGLRQRRIRDGLQFDTNEAARVREVVQGGYRRRCS